jgi:putative membrane-bound dehydrogenase-like protein
MTCRKSFLLFLLLLLAVTPAQSQDPAITLDEQTNAQPIHIRQFAADPDLLSPANIDVDHRGRVWVCEIVNYRHFRNKDNPPRAEGDRILILEDSNGDGTADKQTVFYQGSDIDSPHGVCVLGEKVIVSAGDSVFVFTDADGDDVPDTKERLFTGIGGQQHDHGIHSFLFGPDGRLYFTFGNEGQRLLDKDGKPVIDLAGNEVVDDRSPYQEGMAFRCNLDGTGVETLGWNFRNNWELCVDSFGTIWQSDNDDDGHRATRLNFVMEYGNYGYRDELTGAGWRTPRIGRQLDIPCQHWHLNDPGVLPNLHQTGAGSPAGICFYEGDQLPHAIVHCDPGINEVRSFPTQRSGAGYVASHRSLARANNDKWFRPVDVCAAPDGSLILADWCDPGVGGHLMHDVKRGRLFRVSSAPERYDARPLDLSTPQGITAALDSPNLATRYLAWQASDKLRADRDAEAAAALTQHLEARFDDVARPAHLRARTLWLLGKSRLEQALSDPDPNIRITAIRLARKLRLDVVELLAEMPESDLSVLRERAVALRHSQSAGKPRMWADLAAAYDGDDRWYLEALGIGAHKDWDQCLEAWLADQPQEVNVRFRQKAARDIVWRSRSSRTPDLLSQLLLCESLPTAEVPRTLRAFDFIADQERKRAVLEELAASFDRLPAERRPLVTLEVASRLPDGIKQQPSIRDAVDEALDSLPGSVEFVANVTAFRIASRYPELLNIAMAHPGKPIAHQAVHTLARQAPDLLDHALRNSDEGSAIELADTLGQTMDGECLKRLRPLVEHDSYPLALRVQAIKGITRSPYTSGPVLSMAKQGQLDPQLRAATASLLHGSSWLELRTAAQELFPLADTKDSQSVPPIVDLIERHGDAVKGQQLYVGAATCNKCHQVNGAGGDVGPDLTEIGDKLSREALYHAILFPSAGISHNYETFHVEIDDGTVAVGLKISETDDAITIRNEAGADRILPRESIEEMSQQDISLMPANLHQLMTTEGLVDLVTYLESLKKGAQ